MKQIFITLLWSLGIIVYATGSGFVLPDNENRKKLDTKTPRKPYYEFNSIKEAKHLGFYGKWVPMYQSEVYPRQRSDYPFYDSDKKFLTMTYESAHLIAILKVTHFYIDCSLTSDINTNMKFRAEVISVIKGDYDKKTIEFFGDFNNAPAAVSFKQLYALHRSSSLKGKDSGSLYSNPFYRYNPTMKIIKYFEALSRTKEEKE